MQQFALQREDVRIVAGSGVAATEHTRLLFFSAADCMLRVAGHLYALGPGSVIVLPARAGGDLLYGKHCQYLALSLGRPREDPFDLQGQVNRLLRGLTHLRPDPVRFSALAADLARLNELAALGEGGGKAPMPASTT